MSSLSGFYGPACPFSPASSPLTRCSLWGHRPQSQGRPCITPHTLRPPHLLPPCVRSPSCPPLFDPMDCSPPDSFVYGIFQARIGSGLPFLIPEDPPDPGSEPASLASPVLAGGLFTTAPSGKPQHMHTTCINRQTPGTHC